MAVDYRECRTAAEALGYLQRIKPRVVVFDVEPLVAHWDSGDDALILGLSVFVREVECICPVDTIVFATNSPRRPSSMPNGKRSEVLYIADAMKPFRTRPFQALAMPGVVVGDQIATDGVLASRLRYSFLRYRGHDHTRPLGPRAMALLGLPLRPLLFRSA